MKKGLLKIDWGNIEKYSHEDISYFLFLEGKSIDSISKIRNINRQEVQRHIVEGKIKYGFFVKSENEKELLNNIAKAGKLDKLSILQSLNRDLKNKLINYIKYNYVNMHGKEKETAVWIIGELKEKSCSSILLKASVHKFINVRRMAVSAMGKIEDKKFEMPLIRALEDDNPQVILYAIKALQKIKSTKALTKIGFILKTSNKEYLKRAAKSYIEEFENKDNIRDLEVKK